MRRPTYRLPEPALPAAADLDALLSCAPQPIDYVLPGLRRGSVGAIVSPGSRDSSQWALQLSVSIATGADLTGLSPKEGKVLVLSGEDDETVLANRLHAMATQPAGNGDATGTEPGAAVLPDVAFSLAIRDGLSYLSCAGAFVDLLDDAVFPEIVRAAAGVRLIVLDGLSHFHTLDETSAPDRVRLLLALEQLARETNAAVLYLEHGVTEADVLSDYTRWVATLSGLPDVDENWPAYGTVIATNHTRYLGTEPTSRYLRWRLTQRADAAPVDELNYRRDDSGVLRQVVLQKREACQPGSTRIPFMPPLSPGQPFGPFRGPEGPQDVPTTPWRMPGDHVPVPFPYPGDPAPPFQPAYPPFAPGPEWPGLGQPIIFCAADPHAGGTTLMNGERQ